MALSTITIEPNSQSTLKIRFGNLYEFKKILSELTKFSITFFVSVTTFVGYILHSGEINFNLVLPTIGVLVLACGASALNEYQERKVDSKMKRTSSRPIPSGRIPPNNAMLVSLVFIGLGLGILALHSSIVMFLGLFTLLWYNGIYTPLKQKSAIAIIPGALVGALPPVIGWAASGGNIFDTKILAFATFMFVWQIPHFWLLLLMYDDQYKKAGFPTLSRIFSFNKITKITFSWIVLLIASSILFYLSELSVSMLSNVSLFLLGVGSIFLSLKVITDRRREVFKNTFLLINAYVLCVLIVITIENII